MPIYILAVTVFLLVLWLYHCSFLWEMCFVFYFHVFCYPDSFSSLKTRLLPLSYWICSWLFSGSVKPHSLKHLGISTSCIPCFTAGFTYLSNSWIITFWVIFLIAHIKRFSPQLRFS